MRLQIILVPDFLDLLLESSSLPITLCDIARYGGPHRHSVLYSKVLKVLDVR